MDYNNLVDSTVHRVFTSVGFLRSGCFSTGYFYGPCLSGPYGCYCVLGITRIKDTTPRRGDGAEAGLLRFAEHLAGQPGAGGVEGAGLANPFCCRWKAFLHSDTACFEMVSPVSSRHHPMVRRRVAVLRHVLADADLVVVRQRLLPLALLRGVWYLLSRLPYSI